MASAAGVQVARPGLILSDRSLGVSPGFIPRIISSASHAWCHNGQNDVPVVYGSVVIPSISRRMRCHSVVSCRFGCVRRGVRGCECVCEV
jgi:hypothetical protein